MPPLYVYTHHITQSYTIYIPALLISKIIWSPQEPPATAVSSSSLRLLSRPNRTSRWRRGCSLAATPTPPSRAAAGRTSSDRSADDCAVCGCRVRVRGGPPSTSLADRLESDSKKRPSCAILFLASSSSLSLSLCFPRRDRLKRMRKRSLILYRSALASFWRMNS